ncbi:MULTISPECIES: hypothetical protein [unclassified Yoonia]|uniref:hypothetical protein n=1 Tax=unclassified Yoonia TaxID=2629118 RepID=UPI002AFE5465|nr:MULTISPECIES: hypothetical protein [unclassified Yoonia]
MTNPQDPNAPATDQERRALDAEEMEMANQSRNPALATLPDNALSDLIQRLRARRNRARDIADRQGREARAKAAPAGATPASRNDGTLSKHDYLNAALDRVTAEREARQAKSGSAEAADQPAPTQHDLSQKALATKTENAASQNEMMEGGSALHPHDPDASSGKGDMADKARKTAPSGALDHAGELPSRERSRTRY